MVNLCVWPISCRQPILINLPWQLQMDRYWSREALRLYIFLIFNYASTYCCAASIKAPSAFCVVVSIPSVTVLYLLSFLKQALHRRMPERTMLCTQLCSLDQGAFENKHLSRLKTIYLTLVRQKWALTVSSIYFWILLHFSVLKPSMGLFSSVCPGLGESPIKLDCQIQAAHHCW